MCFLLATTRDILNVWHFFTETSRRKKLYAAVFAESDVSTHGSMSDGKIAVLHRTFPLLPHLPQPIREMRLRHSIHITFSSIITKLYSECSDRSVCNSRDSVSYHTWIIWNEGLTEHFQKHLSGKSKWKCGLYVMLEECMIREQKFNNIMTICYNMNSFTHHFSCRGSLISLCHIACCLEADACCTQSVCLENPEQQKHKLESHGLFIRGPQKAFLISIASMHGLLHTAA